MESVIRVCCGCDCGCSCSCSCSGRWLRWLFGLWVIDYFIFIVASVIIEIQQYYTPYVSFSPHRQFQLALANGCLEWEEESGYYFYFTLLIGV